MTKFPKAEHCATGSHIHDVEPDVPSFKTAAAAIEYLTPFFNRTEPVTINFHEMPDKEIKKYHEWIKENLCKYALKTFTLKDMLKMAHLIKEREHINKEIKKVSL